MVGRAREGTLTSPLGGVGREESVSGFPGEGVCEGLRGIETGGPGQDREWTPIRSRISEFEGPQGKSPLREGREKGEGWGGVPSTFSGRRD